MKKLVIGLAGCCVVAILSCRPPAPVTIGTPAYSVQGKSDPAASASGCDKRVNTLQSHLDNVKKNLKGAPKDASIRKLEAIIQAADKVQNCPQIDGVILEATALLNLLLTGY